MVQTDVILRWAVQAASQLAMSVQPSSAPQNGIVFPQQPTVQLKSAGGGNVALGGVAVTVAVASGAGVLSGTLTRVTDGSGLATFDDLKITGLVGNRTLQFTAPTLSPVTSSTIGLVAGPATDLLPVSPATGNQTVSTAGAIQVKAVDQSGNATSGVTVTFTVATGGGSTTPGSAVTDGAGLASTTWTIGAGVGTDNNELDAAA